MIDSGALRFPAPAGQAAAELNALLDAYEAAVRRRRAVDAEQRAAGDAAHEASEDVTALERQRAQGDEPPPAALKAATRKLAEARARADEPWPERRRAGDSVVREAERAVAEHLEQHAEELLAEVEVEGRDAADAVTDAARVLVEAHRRRGQIEVRLVNVVHWTFPGNEGHVTRSVADQVAGAAERLAVSGERAPSIDRRLLPAREPVAS